MQIMMVVMAILRVRVAQIPPPRDRVLIGEVLKKIIWLSEMNTDIQGMLSGGLRTDSGEVGFKIVQSEPHA